MTRTLKLIADRDGEKPIFEEVLVEQINANRFLLSRSPGLVPGLAAGDEFELSDDEAFGYRILKRGGNICVQIFFPHGAEQCRLTLVPLAEKIGGRLDGCTSVSRSGMLVFTFPATAGFPSIESLMSQAKSLSPNCEWYYNNVYDLKDGVTPLNWWSEP